jgi:hypothetical protein
LVDPKNDLLDYIRGVSKKFGEWYQKTAHRTPLIWRRRRQIRGMRWVDFFLFPRLKSIMKGARFADVAAIQEHVTAVL